MSIHSNRKNEHVDLAQEFYKHSTPSPFQDLRFVHHSLPQMATSDVNLSTSFAGLEMDFPLYINAMTGGSEYTSKINADLAEIASRTGLAIASGSISVAMKDESTAPSFKVMREKHPEGLIFANLGAHHSVENMQKAIQILDADAMQIHVNTPQEIVMPEGDRDFTSWEDNIRDAIQTLEVPVIVKEVGYGMSRETIAHLVDLGVEVIDLGGYGGTNFNQIENARRNTLKYDDLLDWGQTTPISLLEATDFIGKTSILASGGVREPLDIVKSMALGASAVGMSGHILHYVIEYGVDATVEYIEDVKEEIRGIYTILGVRNHKELRQKNDLIISGTSRDWCEARGIDYRHFAQRSY